MHIQSCPVCLQTVDVSIYVTGQKARCQKCGNRFLVSRSSTGETRAPSAAASPEKANEKPLKVKHSKAPNTRPERPSLTQQRAKAAEAPEPPPPPPPRDDVVPTRPRIHGYEMMSMLGQGAMGTVWKAIERGTGQAVAIKILVEHLAKSPDFIWRFEREARAMQVVDHKCVIKFKGTGSGNGLHFIIMEYVDGNPLRREMEQTRMPTNRVVAVARRVARGLHAAHEKGVVHRDLKPENVLISRAGDLKIVDFGLAGMAAEVDPHPNLTRSRVTMGTVNYMAPEQRTDAKRVDRKADVYSLGVMLFEMLTRELPIGRHLMPVERGMNLPPLVDVILRKALAYNKEDRHQTAQELDTDLDKLEKQLAAAGSADSKKGWWPFA